MKRFVLSAIVLALGLVVARGAHAVPIVPTDLDSLEPVPGKGPSIVAVTTDDFTSVANADIGDLTNDVFFNSTTGIYTYTHMVTPMIDNITEFNTSFAVLGFNGVAGWDFDDSLALGATGTAADFSINQDGDGTIDWEAEFNNDFWDAGESVTFFFQSTLPPGLGNYNLIDSQVGTGTSYAPVLVVNEPASLLLLGSGLLGLVYLRRRRAA